MVNAPAGPEKRRQFGEAMLFAGLAAVVGTPIVYRVRSAGAHSHATRNWLWPTWWMLVPLAGILIGWLLVRLPDSIDLRRSLLRSRLFSRRREH